MGISTIQRVILSTCKSIWEALVDEVLPFPMKEAWLHSAAQFERRWNLPNCIGALDGKHVVLTQPANSGSQFYNYKGSFSMNLMAIANSEYRFMLIDIGAYGSQADGGVWKMSTMGTLFQEHKLNIPLGRRLPDFGDEGPVPYYLAADEAFPLQPDIMRPFAGKDRCEKERNQKRLLAANLETDLKQKGKRDLSERQMVYNYRLSRGRCIIENTFGIAAHRFRVMLSPMQVKKPEHAEVIIMAVVCLHNFLTKEIVSVASVMARLNQTHHNETQQAKRQ